MGDQVSRPPTTAQSTTSVWPFGTGTAQPRLLRYGTTKINLYAASGQVISELTPRHRAEALRRFLNRIDVSVAAHLDVSIVLDNSSTHKTPSIQRSLIRRPRFRLHFTPTYRSWLNLVGRWFAELTKKSIKRGSHRAVRDLFASIRTWITNWKDDPKTLRLAQERRPDPRKPRLLLPANQRLRADQLGRGGLRATRRRLYPTPTKKTPATQRRPRSRPVNGSSAFDEVAGALVVCGVLGVATAATPITFWTLVPVWA